MSSDPAGEGTSTTPNYQLYWCYQCHRIVRIAAANPSEIICPQCFGQFLGEINNPRPRFVVDYTQFDPSPQARLLEALSLILDPPIRRSNNLALDNQGFELRGRSRLRPRGDVPDNMERVFTHPRDDFIEVRPRPRPRSRRRNRSLDSRESLDLDGNGTLDRIFTWIFLTPGDPSRPIILPPRREGLGLTGNNPGDFFSGQGIEQLIEGLTQNDRPGPPPAPDSAIDAIPTVTIEPSHLNNDTQCCPVCKEEFKVGGEARELSCHHLYHSDCIVPWLQLHNSCPVCRQEVPLVSDPEIPVDDLESRVEGRCPRWLQRRHLRPFRPRHRQSHPPANSGGIPAAFCSSLDFAVAVCGSILNRFV
ncbi:RING-type E3 ubiquitin transferase [Psidium guajava]|nr:RING-type E3 ubiquitin transferase [Psidium guajava]